MTYKSKLHPYPIMIQSMISSIKSKESKVSQQPPTSDSGKTQNKPQCKNYIAISKKKPDL